MGTERSPRVKLLGLDLSRVLARCVGMGPEIGRAGAEPCEKSNNIALPVKR